MIEIVFSESTKSAMCAAKKFDNKNVLGGGVENLGTQPPEEILKKMFEGEALEGSSEDVILMQFALDVGDISGDILNEKRKQIISNIYSGPVFNNFDPTDTIWQMNKYNIENIKTKAQNNEKIRIWYSDAPYSICGFYFMNALLKEYDCNLTAIKLPGHKVQGDNVHFYSSWEEITAGKFSQFLEYEREISSAERKAIAERWEELKTQNDRLRAVINGNLIGVPEDFYDYIIRKYITDSEFKVASLVGMIMLKNQLGVSDWWYLQRIKKMIEDGELEIVSNNILDYGKVLKKIN